MLEVNDGSVNDDSIIVVNNCSVNDDNVNDGNVIVVNDDSGV